MIDTGSDVSILGLPFLERFMRGNNWKSKIKGQQQNLVSFTENQIKVIGEIELKFKLLPTQHQKKHRFIVVENPPAQILLGADLIQDNKLFLDYSTVPPKIYQNNKSNPLRSVHIPPQHVNKINIITKLQANETKAVEIPLPDNLINILPTDRILINEEYHEDFILYPTTSSQEDNVIYCLISNMKETPQDINHEVQIDAINPEHLRFEIPGEPEDTILVKSPVVYQEKLKPYLKTLPKKILQKNIVSEGDQPDTTYYLEQQTSAEYDLPYKFEENAYDTENYDEPDSPLCEDFCPQGYELPPKEIPTIDAKIAELNNPPRIDKYVRDIFYKHGSVISRFSLDVGDISKTLGTYSLSLKPKAYFPTVHRSYFLHPEKKEHMDTILQFMIKHKIIRKANDEDIQKCRYSSPCFLTTRSNKESPHRLLIDFRFLNDQLSFLPPIMPRLDDLLNGLRGAYYFSVVDLNQAFLQFSVDKASQPYTRFFYNQRSYVHLRLPMGWAGSPGYFQSAIEDIIDKEPVFDERGNLQYNADGTAKLRSKPLSNSKPYLDDIITFSSYEKNPEHSLKIHFEKVEMLIKRLAQHSVKISLEKSEFAKTSIDYLGFSISHNTIVCNPKRIDKLLSTPLPTSKKGLRNLMGLLNSVRQYTDNDIANYMDVLTPLTSIKADFKLEKKHIDAINQIKKLMTQRPIFGHMISKTSPKIVFSDASSSENGHLSAVLCQVIPTEQDLPFPSCLSPMDPVHEIIIRDRLPVEPLLLPHEKGGDNKANKVDLPVPYLGHLKHKFLGYDEKEYPNSLLISLREIQKHHKNNPYDEQKMRNEAVKFVKKKNLHLRLSEAKFGGDKNKCREYLEEFLKGKEADEHEILLEGIAKYLRRKIYIIDSTTAAEAAVTGINEELLTGAWYLGKYQHNGNIIYRPYINVRFEPSSLTHLSKRLELIAFYSKSLGKDQANKAIIELEALAVVHALKKFEDYLKHCDVTLYCDNKSFFSMFMNDHTNYNMPHKLLRYATYIRTTFPRLNMRFVNSDSQLADFVSRAYKSFPRQLKTLKMSDVKISDKLHKLTPSNKTFKLKEFEKLVKSNQDTLLEVNDITRKEIFAVSYTSGQLQERSYLDAIFNERLSRNNIIKEQKLEFTYYINKCLSSDDFTYVRDKIEYKLINNLLMVCTKGHMAILVPDSLIGYLIAYVHLKNGHTGLHGCLHNLSIYSFPNKKQRIMDLLRACYSCFFVSPKSNVMVKNNFLPPPDFPGELWYADYAESLPPDNGYKHILIFVCGLSGIVLAFPRKAITTQSLIYDFLYSVYPYFPVKTIISDNGSTFASKDFNELCHSLNIKKPRISSLSPRTNKCEIYVGKIKRLLKKLSVQYKTERWLTNLALVTRVLNTQIQSSKKLAPLHFLYGSEMNATKTSLIDLPFNKQSDQITDYSYVETRTLENKRAIEFLRKELASAAEEKIEKKPILTPGDKLKEGDIVFVRKHYHAIGTSRALLPKFSRDPFVVVEATDQAAVVRRLADGFVTKYDTRNLKLFKRDDIDFAMIPDSIKNILLKGFQNLTTTDLKQVRQASAFDELTGNITSDNQKSHPLDELGVQKYQDEPKNLTVEDILPPSADLSKSDQENITNSKGNKKESNKDNEKDILAEANIYQDTNAPEYLYPDNDTSIVEYPLTKNDTSTDATHNLTTPSDKKKQKKTTSRKKNPVKTAENENSEEAERTRQEDNPDNREVIENPEQVPDKTLKINEKLIEKEDNSSMENNLPSHSSVKLKDEILLSPTEEDEGNKFQRIPDVSFQNSEILDELHPQFPDENKETAQKIKVKLPTKKKSRKKKLPKSLVKNPISSRTRAKKLEHQNDSDSDEEKQRKSVKFNVPNTDFIDNSNDFEEDPFLEEEM